MINPVIDKPHQAAQTQDCKQHLSEETMSSSPNRSELQINPKIVVEDLHFHYGDKQALFKINLLIGPCILLFKLNFFNKGV